MLESQGRRIATMDNNRVTMLQNIKSVLLIRGVLALPVRISEHTCAGLAVVRESGKNQCSPHDYDF